MVLPRVGTTPCGSQNCPPDFSPHNNYVLWHIFSFSLFISLLRSVISATVEVIGYENISGEKEIQVITITLSQEGSWSLGQETRRFNICSVRMREILIVIGEYLLPSNEAHGLVVKEYTHLPAFLIFLIFMMNMNFQVQNTFWLQYINIQRLVMKLSMSKGLAVPQTPCS